MYNCFLFHFFFLFKNMKNSIIYFQISISPHELVLVLEQTNKKKAPNAFKTNVSSHLLRQCR